MNLVRLQYGGGGGELHGASITVNTEETTLVGKEALLYKVSDLSTIINRTVFSALSSDGVSTATFNNIIEPDTYIVKSSNGTEEGNTSNIEITSDDIINKTTLVRSLNLTLELNVTFYSASGETIKYKRQNSDELILLGKADNTGKGNGTIICKDGETITFSGDIAKDTTGTTAYSKDIIITADTTKIKVMPDGAIYWYGYNNIKASGKAIYNHNNYTTSGFIYTVSTHSITVGVNTNNYSSYGHVTDAPVDITEYTNLKANIMSVLNNDWAGIFISTNQYRNGTNAVSTNINTIGIKTLDISNAINKNVYVGIGANNNIQAHSEIQFNALWLE